jgi:predicted nucleic acid-binding protein
MKGGIAYPNGRPAIRSVFGPLGQGFPQELSVKAEITPGELVVDVIKNDPSDNIYLVCAVEGKAANFIVSGDAHLKNLHSFQSIPILDPATFLRSMTGKEQ